MQIGAFLLTAAYLLYRRIELRRRACRSWREIASSLSPVWGKAITGSSPLRLIDPRVLVHDSAVMMEVADYAECNARHPDHASIHGLRSDVLHIRVSALKALLLRKSSI